MTKVTYKRKHVVGHSTFRGWESMTIIAGSMTAGRHGAGAGAELSHLETQPQRERAHCAMLLKPQKAVPHGTAPSKRSHFLVLPKNNSTNLGRSIQACEPLQANFIQATKIGK